MRGALIIVPWQNDAVVVSTVIPTLHLLQQDNARHPGRIIHRAAYSMGRGRFEATPEPPAAARRGSVDLGEGLVSLAPGGVSCLATHGFELPLFCPDTKHAASLQRVSHVCADLEQERARLVAENAENARRKLELEEEMASLEERLRQILERKATLDTDLLAAEAAERRGARLITGLDAKIDAIGESSLRFEESVRSIAGEVRDAAHCTVLHCTATTTHTPVAVHRIAHPPVSPAFRQARLEIERGAPSPRKGAAPAARMLERASSPARQRRMALRDALGLEQGTLQAHVGGVAALVKGTGPQLVTAGVDGTVKLWEAHGAVEVDVGQEIVTCVDIEASRLVLGTASGMVVVWERDTRQARLRFAAHAGEVTCITIQAGAILSGGADYSIKQFASTTGKTHPRPTLRASVARQRRRRSHPACLHTHPPTQESTVSLSRATKGECSVCRCTLCIPYVFLM